MSSYVLTYTINYKYDDWDQTVSCTSLESALKTYGRWTSVEYKFLTHVTLFENIVFNGKNRGKRVIKESHRDNESS